MNILIITGNPKPENHTKLIAEAYKKKVEEHGHATQMIDVYSAEYALPYTTSVPSDITPEVGEKIRVMQDMVSWADEIIVVHPIWWASFPAGLKNWVDSIFVPKFAFKYLPGGKVQKLLTGKKAKVFATAGSHAPYYNIPIVKQFTPLFIMWRYAMFGFFGIKVTEIHVQDCMNTNDSCPPEGCFEQFLNRVERSAMRH